VHLRSGLEYSTPEHIAYRQGVLERHGFSPVRYWFKMARDLNEPIPEPQLPEGFILRHVQDEKDGELWVDVFNWSFIDHWNHHDLSMEEYRHYVSSPKYNKERDLVAVAPDGTFAAFCFCWIDPEDNEHNNRKEGWIDILGTRRGYRNKGLGTAMLLAGMHLLKADGMDTAVLGVDAENPTGALRLYESVGFKQVVKNSTWHKDL
jgi:mycothiol synthase